MKQFCKKVFTILFSIVALLCITGIAPVNAQSNDDCMLCHEDTELSTEYNGITKSLYVDTKVLNKSAHKNTKCIGCHKDANVSDFPHPENLKTVNCANCHGDIWKQQSNDIHHTLKDIDPKKIPDCKTCHGNHNILSIASVNNKDELFCGKCHSDKKLSAPYHIKATAGTNCTNCHNDNNYKQEIGKSVHASLSCSNCHGFVASNIEAHQEKPEEVKQADCYLCHHDIAEEHKESIHGISLSEGVKEAAQCWDCHGSHSIVPTDSTASMVHDSNLVSTCGSCHDDPDFAEEHQSSIKQPGKMYTTSVHGKLLAEGSDKSASCITCHGVHNIKNRIQPGSTISSLNLPDVCGQCHKEITKAYKQSIHWIGVKRGVRESPACNDCHSEHSIRAINTVDKREEVLLIQENTCLSCHQNLLLSQRYGLEGAAATNYQDTYHGLAVARGDDEAAMCIDCHGVHKILPDYHEESTIHESQIVETCAECHKGATKTFSRSYSHTSQESETVKYAEWLAETIYTWLIIIVIGGMVVHNIIIFARDIRQKYNKNKKKLRIPRFNTNELIQHTILLVSFIVLAFSGFHLKYPDAFWVKFFHNIGINESIRQDIHRISAVVMVALSAYHAIYLVVTKRGREVLLDIFPRPVDIKHFFQYMKYNLGLSKKHPEFGNFNYMEKAEYWALIWGTLVMAFTGFILWFPTSVGIWAPEWLIKVSQAIHFYEAILATLAIVVWHWFFVVFRPKEYPINFVSIDGQMTVEHYKEEHKMRYKKVIVEWNEMKEGKRTEKQLRPFTKLFIKTIKKQGVEPEEFFKSEVERDPTLLDLKS